MQPNYASANAFRICCPVCFDDYDEYYRIPYFISPKTCGHSICSVCLPKVLEWKPECPLCRTPCCPDQSGSRINNELQDLCERLSNQKLFLKTVIDVNEKAKMDYRAMAEKCNLLVREWNRISGKQKELVVEQLDIPNIEPLFQSCCSNSEYGTRKEDWQTIEAIKTVNNLEAHNNRLWEINRRLESEYEKMKKTYESLEIDIWTEREGVKSLNFDVEMEQ